jgi:hypothetical protein
LQTFQNRGDQFSFATSEVVLCLIQPVEQLCDVRGRQFVR